MNILPMLLKQARQGRPDLAAMNLGASGFSSKALKIFVRYSYKDGERTSINRLMKLYRYYRHQAESVCCC
ncbi:MAG: hypothetical protein H8D23_29110 [Candidatus Brocadiales bacterium]|nr:hypothetical protein [Candidatus Brocadiales bacterium]